MSKVFRIATNFERFPELLTRLGDVSLEYSFVKDLPLSLGNIRKIYSQISSADCVVVNGSVRLVLLIAALRFIPRLKVPPIVSVDLILRVPENSRQLFTAKIKAFLLRKVSLFIHYFKDWRGYFNHFQIPESKNVFVPFKCNIWNNSNRLSRVDNPGEFIFSAGRSLRDYRTFVEAMRRLPYPAVILCQSEELLRANGSEFDFNNLPSNVTLIRDGEAGGPGQWFELMSKARFLVVPVLRKSLCASGISTYHDAMALGRPVIISRGPGADDLLTEEQAMLVPAEEVEPLAAAIKNLWEDAALYKRLKSNGLVHAQSLGGELELCQRIISTVLEWHDQTRSSLPG